MKVYFTLFYLKKVVWNVSNKICPIPVRQLPYHPLYFHNANSTTKERTCSVCNQPAAMFCVDCDDVSFYFEWINLAKNLWNIKSSGIDSRNNFCWVVVLLFHHTIYLIFLGLLCGMLQCAWKNESDKKSLIATI